MKRHGFDATSFVFGVLFALAGGAFALTDLSVADVHPIWVAALPLALFGTLAVAWGLKHALGRSEPGDRRRHGARSVGTGPGTPSEQGQR